MTLFPNRLAHHVKNGNIDETFIFNAYFHSIVLYIFDFMTHMKLVIVVESFI